MSAKRAAVQRGDLQKEKAPAIGGGPESCCELRSTLLRARPGPPSVVPEEAKVISRAKREVAHGANDIIGPRKCKGYGWDFSTTLSSGMSRSALQCRRRALESPSQDRPFSDC